MCVERVHRLVISNTYTRAHATTAADTSALFLHIHFHAIFCARHGQAEHTKAAAPEKRTLRQQKTARKATDDVHFSLLHCEMLTKLEKTRTCDAMPRE